MVIAISGEGHAEIDIAVIWFFENNILITSRFRLSDRWMDGQPINSRKSLPFFIPPNFFIYYYLALGGVLLWNAREGPLSSAACVCRLITGGTYDPARIGS